MVGQNMIRILVVGDFLEGSGLTNYLMNTYSHFSSDEFLIDCLSYGGRSDLKEEILDNGWGFNTITPVTKNPVKHLFDWNRFMKKNANKYDIVHFNYSAAWNYFAVKSAKKNGIKKIIVHSHNNYYSKRPKLKVIKFILDTLNNRGKKIIEECSDLELAVSKDAANWMFENGNEAIIQKNGIEIDKFIFNGSAREKLRKEIDSEDNKIIGFIGTLEERKNPVFALKIFENILKREKNVRLLVFGKGPDKEMLKEMVNQFGISNKVKFMGVQKNLEQWYSAMDLFIFPSKNEGFGFVLLEAQINGLPIICSNSIPQEAILTDSVKRISLNKSMDWINSSINTLYNEKRDRNVDSKDNLETIIKAGFSIESTSNELKNSIRKLFNNEEVY